MIRIPLIKIYRGFPELDAFSDEECERYVANAKQDPRYGRGSGLLSLGVMVIGIPLLYVSIQLMRPLFRSMNPGGVVLLLTSWVVPLGVMLLVIRDQMLRRAIAERLASVKCRECRYSLLGLTVREGAVVCPECGEQIVLVEQNLTEDDLLVRREAASTAPEVSN